MYVVANTAWKRVCKAAAGGLADREGVLALKFGLLLPILLLVAGHTVDHARYLREVNALQTAVDAAALGAAKEMGLTDTTRESVGAVAQAMVEAFMKAGTSASALPLPEVKTSVTGDPIEVEVVARIPFEPMFGDSLGLALSEISARAVASVIGKPNICVLGLNPVEARTISLEKDARVTGQNCAVYSNSNHTMGLISKNSAELTATFICSRGGRDGGVGNFSPDPLVDCPSFDDPLASRPEPAVEPCDPAKPTAITFDTTLTPGTYCGLVIGSGAVVTLEDGVFVFRDKPLVVTDGAALIGKAAGLFFAGADATFTFERLSTISLVAPTDGPMAGLLLFGSRSQDARLTYSILSDDARVLIGTIYIPKGELRIDATSPIADESAYTAIVADKMRLYGGPHLILNTNYDATAVPVPKGIKGAGQPVALSR